MKRQVSIEEISDGRLYTSNDLVRADCQGCSGCSTCCRGMGNSIILDPLDVFRLTEGLKCSPARLFEEGFLEWNVVEGVILPNLAMSPDTGACCFLDEKGRCRIHSARPGICRLFPLGRYYRYGEDSSAGAEDFRYFLQIHECPKTNRTKIKVKKWLETENLAGYEEYILTWHNLLEKAGAFFQNSGSEELQKRGNVYLMTLFYMKEWDHSADFYVQFSERLDECRNVLGLE